MQTKRRHHNMKKPLILPKFKNEDEESEFWSNLDISKYFNPSDFKHFDAEEFYEKYLKPDKPKTTKITIRVPDEIVKKYKEKASVLDVPYQSLMKQELAKGVAESANKTQPEFKSFNNIKSNSDKAESDKAEKEFTIRSTPSSVISIRDYKGRSIYYV